MLASDVAAALTEHTGRTYTRARHHTALDIACGIYAVIQRASAGVLLQPAVARQQPSATAGLLCTASRNDRLQSSAAKIASKRCTYPSSQASRARITATAALRRPRCSVGVQGFAGTCPSSATIAMRKPQHRTYINGLRAPACQAARAGTKLPSDRHERC